MIKNESYGGRESSLPNYGKNVSFMFDIRQICNSRDNLYLTESLENPKIPKS